MAGIYTWGPISGGHFNPAVTFGLTAAEPGSPGKTFPATSSPRSSAAPSARRSSCSSDCSDLTGGSAQLRDGGFASNGYGSASPGGFGLGAAIVAEVLLTAIFLLVILGVTHPQRNAEKFAGLVIGFTLTMIHLVSIPIDNTSVNPARSIATAIYGGGGNASRSCGCSSCSLWSEASSPDSHTARCSSASRSPPSRPRHASADNAPRTQKRPSPRRRAACSVVDAGTEPQTRSNRSSSVTLPHAFTKSRTNCSFASSLA